MYPEYMLDDDDNLIMLSKDESEKVYLKSIAQEIFAENCQIYVDKVVNISDIDISSIKGLDVEIDDEIEEAQDAIEEAKEDYSTPIKSLVRGRIAEGDIEVSFIAIVYEDDTVKVSTGEVTFDSYDIREKAAELVEERLLNYLE